MLTRLVYSVHIMAAHDGQKCEMVKRTYVPAKRFKMGRTVVVVCNDTS